MKLSQSEARLTEGVKVGVGLGVGGGEAVRVEGWWWFAITFMHQLVSEVIKSCPCIMPGEVPENHVGYGIYVTTQQIHNIYSPDKYRVLLENQQQSAL